ncbi:hypothetical protein [Nocardia asteroides]|uniref:hypothetical protein n=1 Tax=Nocardia asteroides TaxID=1824 RepID=UPI001E4FB12A|nr:hypothetical protein [Nocardia asteroides]UGT62861.1 hypothetical protein LTT61_05855 [Nocardia asteroides]
MAFCSLSGSRLTTAVTVLATVASSFGAASVVGVLPTTSAQTRLGVAALLALSGAGAFSAGLSLTEQPVLQPLTAVAMSLATIVITALMAQGRDLIEKATVADILIAVGAAAPVLALGGAGIYYDLAPAERSSPFLVGAAIVGLFIGFTAPVIKSRFDSVIEAESHRMSSRLISAKWAAYTTTGGLSAATLLAFLAYAIGVYSHQDWVGGYSTSTGALYSFALALGLALLSLLVIGGIARGARRGTIATVFACLTSLSWSIYVLVALGKGFHSYVQATAAVYVGVLAAFFIGQGVIANTTTLHRIRVSWASVAIGGSCAVSIGLTVAWSIGPAIADASGIRSTLPAVAGLLLAIIAGVAIPPMMAITLPGSTPKRQYAAAAPIAGVFQDAFVTTLLWVSVGWVPLFFLNHINGKLAWCGPLLMYASMLGSAYLYVMSNNIKHVDNDWDHLKSQVDGEEHRIPNDQRDAHNALRRHIFTQNLLALFAIVPAFILLLQQLRGFKDKESATILRWELRHGK